MFFRKKKAPAEQAPDGKKKKKSGLVNSLIVGLVIGGAVGSIVGKGLIEERENKRKKD